LVSSSFFIALAISPLMHARPTLAPGMRAFGAVALRFAKGKYIFAGLHKDCIY